VLTRSATPPPIWYASLAVAREAGDFQAEHRDRRQGARSAAFDSARSGKSEIFVDNRDLLRRPSEFGCAGSKGILTLGQFAVVFDLLDSDASNRAAASRRLAAQGSREASS
jgi:hypothetical protein